MPRAATAPAPTRPAPGKGSGGALKAAGVVVLILAGIGFASSQGWFSGGPDPDTDPGSDAPKKLVTFEAVWGQIRDTGEVYEDTGKPVERLECDDREVNLTAFVDGEAQILDPMGEDALEPCVVRYSVAVIEGSELRLLFEEVGAGGWKLCVIYVENRIALPNGWAVQTAGGDCEVWGLAL